MQNSPSAHSKWLPNRQRDATKIRLSNLRRSESTDRAKPRDISRRAPARCKSRRGNYQTDCQICLSRPPLRIDPYQCGVSSKARYCVPVSHTGDLYVVSFFMLCLTMMIFAGDANAVSACGMRGTARSCRCSPPGALRLGGRRAHLPVSGLNPAFAERLPSCRISSGSS